MPGSNHLRAGAAEDFAPPGAEKHYPPDLELEPVHLAIDLAVDPASRTVQGSVVHTVRAHRSGSSELVLHGVALEDVAVADPDGRPLTWRYDGREVRLEWTSPFAADETRRVEVRYRVEE